MNSNNTEQPIARSWWSRNWAWFVPVGIVLPILVICGGGIALMIYLIATFAMDMLRSQPPYTESLAMMQSMPTLQQALGTPIQGSEFVAGNISINNNTGMADITYEIVGPNDDADVHVVATLTNGQWTFSIITATVDDTGETIDVLAWEGAVKSVPAAVNTDDEQ